MRYLLLIPLLALSFSLSAQCRKFAKENCKESLQNYIPSGQSNTAELKPGERYQFMVTFYKGQHYRVVTCSDPKLGNLQFTIRNAKRQLYYDNEGNENRTFDFKVASTQQLVISLLIPKSAEANSDELMGCVSAIVGFRL